ncbi:sphingomyelin phosphodiesterase 4 [Daktulosphaira vitifoliae]|uniref:sphingomyelin phosphodiesterase 4 n=1 Tax=Daktulosphaira vitifoliae TaxID=58002 RepID=UPI0021AA7C54|nr:sphingomyelin phosphodiesterase 4 [Daktulosphaira vitifoliae]
MNSPFICYSPSNSTRNSSSSFSTPSKGPTPVLTVIDTCQLLTTRIEEWSERDLQNSFTDKIYEILGRGSARGLGLDQLKIRIIQNQRYMSKETEAVYYLLSCQGPIFKLCYMLLSNSSFKFHVNFSDIPIELARRIQKLSSKTFYGLRFLQHSDSSLPVGLLLNSFEFYMFHFTVYGLKLISLDSINNVIDSNEQSLYRYLCLEYLNFFLPLENSAAMVPPQLQYNVLSSMQSQKPFSSPGKTFSFIRKDVTNIKDLKFKMLSSDVESSSCVLTSEATWRSELLAFYFADIWLSCNYSSTPSSDLTKIVRLFIKHLHNYSNCADHKPLDNLKLMLSARYGVKIYQYLAHYMDHWPQDFSFRLLLENWLSYIQPWRYDGSIIQQRVITEKEMNDKWKIFIIRNLLCYTKLFYRAIKRFNCIDICSPRYSAMIFRLLKVFTHPYLLKIVLDIENSFLNNKPQQKTWNLLLSESLVETEGPYFKYEAMFSDERMVEYKLFHTKLQKSLEHVAQEFYRFQEDRKDRNNSSFFDMMLPPRKNKISDFTLPEWEEIQTNLKSSKLFMEQIINNNATNTPITENLLNWSVSSLNLNQSQQSLNVSFASQSSATSLEYISPSKKINRSIEWEIDPDFLDTLSYENNYLVKLSIYLRNAVERYWYPFIINMCISESVIAGVLRQAIIRPPMKIYIYEPRQDGSGRKVRTPKVIPPTISFRPLASYFRIFWVLFIITLIMQLNSFSFWIFVWYTLKIIYMCIKYILGYAPVYNWNFSEN